MAVANDTARPCASHHLPDLSSAVLTDDAYERLARAEAVLSLVVDELLEGEDSRIPPPREAVTSA